jgi:hypothetical protein
LGATDDEYTCGNTPITPNSEEAKGIVSRLLDCGIPKSVSQVLLTGLAPAANRPTAQELQTAYNQAIENMES